MKNFYTRTSEKIINFFRSLNSQKKIAAVLILLVIMVGLSVIMIWTSKQTYVPLTSNLSAEDSGNIIRMLKEKHISFRVDETGKNVSVPPEDFHMLKLELATLGLPQSSVNGYELFDKQSLGTTNFVQKINQKRALEGELMRTINTIRGVKRSRVHLALPQKSTFVEDQKKSTASVVLELEIGSQLNEKQVFGIGSLVARAVEGMEITDVVIMNADGKILSKNPSDSLTAATATQLDYQQKVESDLEKRIEGILSRVVGDGHVVAKVTADIDFSQVQETQTLYDADGSAIRSVEKHNDSMNGTRPGPSGVSGSSSNTPGVTPAANSQVKTATIKNNEVTNYEVPQTIRKTMHSMGGIKKLSVAVVVNGKQVFTTGKDGKTVKQFEDWSPEKVKEFESLIASSIGINKKRGDILEIKNMQFTHEDVEEASRMIAEIENKNYLKNLVVYAVIGLTILMFFLFVVRPFIKWITENTVESVDTFLPQTLEELERMQKNSSLPNIEDSVPILPESMDPVKVEGEMIREKIITLIDANPHKAALILKDWLHSEAKKPGDAKAEGNDSKAAAG